MSFRDARYPRLAGLPIDARSLEHSIELESLDEPDWSTRLPRPVTSPGPDRYRILEQAGRGATGTVYKALDQQLGRIVALKRLELAAPGAQLRSLSREIHGAGKLTHPHIVTLYDCGADRHGPFLTFEWVEGPSLAQRLKSGALPFETAITVATQIGEALGHAHRHGILHRDIKPANVLLASNPDGSVTAKLTDFGLASACGSLLARSNLAGTRPYIAPEVEARGPSDHRADLYSFSMMFGQMLTGKLPVDTSRMSPQMADLLSRGLARNPALRFFSIDELLAALPRKQPVVRSTPEASAVRPAPRRPSPARCPDCRTTTPPGRQFCPRCGMNVARYVKLRAFLARQQVKYLWGR